MRIEVTDVDASTLDVGVFAELTGPSLFASERVLVLRALENLPSEMVPHLIEYAGATSDDVLVVLVHSGGQKGKAVLDKLRKASVNEVVATAPKAWELPQFVAGEIRLHGGTVDERAASALVDAVGHDLRALAGACSQLVSDAGGQAVTAELIGQYFGGRAEVTSFAVADAAIAGRTEPALEQLRWALDCGVAPVLVTSAMAGGLRGLAKFASAPGGLRETDLAREVGVPPWKLKQLEAAVPRLDPGRAGDRDQGGSPGRRRREGRLRRRRLRPRAHGHHRQPSPRPPLTPQTRRVRPASSQDADGSRPADRRRSWVCRAPQSRPPRARAGRGASRR